MLECLTNVCIYIRSSVHVFMHPYFSVHVQQRQACASFPPVLAGVCSGWSGARLSSLCVHLGLWMGNWLRPHLLSCCAQLTLFQATLIPFGVATLPSPPHSSYTTSTSWGLSPFPRTLESRTSLMDNQHPATSLEPPTVFVLAHYVQPHMSTALTLKPLFLLLT